ncbi:MAG: radical SAM protein [Polyangiaceae bacterium]
MGREQPRVLFIDCINSRRIISLGPYYLQASLRQQGIDSTVLPVREGEEDADLRRIADSNPDIIGLSVDISNVEQSAALATRLKERSSALIVAGGPHVTLEQRQFMVDYPCYDMLCVGEGEETMLDIVRAVAAGKRPVDVSGTIVRDRGMVRHNGERPLIEDLDRLAFPAYENIPFNGHIHPIITSRGCPWDCVFCCTKKLYSSRRWRARSPENVVEELRAIRARGFRRVGIWDDAFNTDVKRAKRIFELVIEADLGLQYSFPNGVRANCLDDELVRLMRRAGVIRIPFGVEDLDPEVSRGIGKNLKPETLAHACRLLHAHGYRTEAFMILGLPGSTPASTLRSLRRLRASGIDLARWYIAVPYTNTDLFRWVRDHATMLEHEEYGTGTWSSNPPVLFETADFRKADRLRLFHFCNADMNNFLVLGGEAQRHKLWVALTILARVLRHRPHKLPRLLPWFVDAARNPMRAIFNEPFRPLSRAERRAAEGSARANAARPSPRSTNWLPSESLRRGGRAANAL